MVPPRAEKRKRLKKIARPPRRRKYWRDCTIRAGGMKRFHLFERSIQSRTLLPQMRPIQYPVLSPQTKALKEMKKRRTILKSPSAAKAPAASNKSVMGIGIPTAAT